MPPSAAPTTARDSAPPAASTEARPAKVCPLEPDERGDVNGERDSRRAVTGSRAGGVHDRDTELQRDQYRQRRHEMVEDGVDPRQPTTSCRREPREELGHVPPGHLDPASLPPLILAVRLRQGVRHLGPEHGVGFVGHELAVEQQLVLELGVLDEVTGPATSVEQRPGEHHAVAIQTGRSAEPVSTERTEVVPARQAPRSESSRRARGRGREPSSSPARPGPHAAPAGPSHEGTRGRRWCRRRR